MAGGRRARCASRTKLSQNRRRPWKSRSRARTAGRQALAAAAHRAKPCGSSVSIRARSAWAKTGAPPSVEIADDERRTVDDRAELEVRRIRPVDDIDRHARGARRGGESLRLVVALDIGERERRRIEVVGPEGALGEHDACVFARQRPHLLGRLEREDVDPRAGGGEEFGLPGRALRAAREHDAAPGELEKNRQRGERREARQGRGLRFAGQAFFVLPSARL